MQQPGKDEYRDYYGTYIDKVPEGNIIEIMLNENKKTMQLLRKVSEEKSAFRYEEGKWTLKEVLGHMIDVERVFSFRAYQFSRKDPQPLPGMEQEDHIEAYNYSGRTFADMLDEFENLRSANTGMFRGFTEEMGMRSGLASGFKFTLRSIAYILAGHEIHHRKFIEEKYLR